MIITCKPSDYYTYSKTYANKYGVAAAILISYLCDTLTCEPDHVQLNYDHITTMTGLSKQEIKDAAKSLQKSELVSVTINDSIVISVHQEQKADTRATKEIDTFTKSDPLPFDKELKDLTDKYLSKTTDKYLNNSSRSKKNDKYHAICQEIVDFANKTWHTSFTCNNETKKYIKHQLRNGHTKEEFFKVIVDRWNEWGVKPVIFKSSGSLSNEFLRPRTVFTDKFEEYLEKANKRDLQQCKKKMESAAVYKRASSDKCDDLEF